MLDCLAVSSLLPPRVCLKIVLELRLGCLVEFLLWSANIVLSDLISRPFFPTVPFRCVARFSLAFPHVTFPFYRALLARLLFCPVSVASRVARSTSRPQRLRFVARCSLDFSCVDELFPSLGGVFYSLSTVCCVLFPLRWVCVLRGFGLFGVCI